MSEAYQRPGRILLVEDNEQSRVMMAAFYKRRGFEVIEADNAESAVQHVPNADIVISDIEQPNSKGGYGLLSYVRENYPSIPVILMSGRGVEREKAQGAVAFFPKPFSSIEVLEDMLLAMPAHLTPTQHLKQTQTPPQA